MRALRLGDDMRDRRYVMPRRIRAGTSLRVGGAGFEHGERQHEVEVIVGGDAAEALDAAGEASVHDHVLAVTAGERADRRHAAAAVAGAIAGRGAVDVAGIEAPGTVVAVVPAGGEGAHERAAVAAAKVVAAGSRALGAGAGSLCLRQVAASWRDVMCRVRDQCSDGGTGARIRRRARIIVTAGYTGVEPKWRNGRRDGLKNRSRAIGVWVRLPPSAPKSNLD